MPLVSVVIPTFNREFVIGKTIQSVLGQTIQDFEIIVVDDGSKDNTKKVVEDFKSSKITYYFQHNQGAQVARNFGLTKASGNYIAFLDSDDVWLPTFLEEMLNAFSADSELGCVYCWIGSNKDGKFTVDARYSLSGYIYVDALKQGYITMPSGLVIKRKCFDVVGPWDVKFGACQDDDMCFRLAKSFKFALIEKPLIVYNSAYEGSENRIGASAKRVAEGWWTLWNKFEDDVLALCGKKVAARHFLECASNFYRAEMPDKCEEAVRKAVSYYGSKGNLRLDFAKEFVEFISSGNVYCYGAGEIGELVAADIKRSKSSIHSFIVTEKSSNATCCGYPVMTVDEVEADNCKIIISTTEKYHPEIENSIKEIIGDVPIFKVSNELINFLRIGNILWGSA